MLGLALPLFQIAKTKLNTLNPPNHPPPSSQPFRAGDKPASRWPFHWVRFALKGSKQAGGSCGGNPLASNPHPKAFRVSTSWSSQPERCGYLRVHLRAGNQGC